MVHELLILLGDVSQPPSSNPPTWLYIFGALLAGGGLTLLGNLVRHWRRGQIEDTEITTRITKDAISGAKDILAEYRVEVEVVKRQVDTYRDQLNKLTMTLAEANIRIANLEKELSISVDAREKLRQDLAVAVEERRKLMAEIEKLHHEVARLLGEDEEVGEE